MTSVSRSMKNSDFQETLSRIHRTSERDPIYEGRPLPFVVGICGGSASGKTTVCEQIQKDLNDRRVCVISQDSFYRPLTDAEMCDVSNFNFDHPDAIDFPLMRRCIRELLRTGQTTIPTYDFVTNSRLTTGVMVRDADVIILEGILLFTSKKLRNMMNLRVFVSSDDDTRLIRRIRRDIVERGRSLAGILTQYEKFVKPSFLRFVQPTMQFADIIIPRGADNIIGIELLVAHLKLKLRDLAVQNSGDAWPLSRRTQSMMVMEDTFSSERDHDAGEESSDDEFIHNADPEQSNVLMASIQADRHEPIPVRPITNAHPPAVAPPAVAAVARVVPAVVAPPPVAMVRPPPSATAVVEAEPAVVYNAAVNVPSENLFVHESSIHRGVVRLNSMGAIQRPGSRPTILETLRTANDTACFDPGAMTPSMKPAEEGVFDME